MANTLSMHIWNGMARIATPSSQPHRWTLNPKPYIPRNPQPPWITLNPGPTLPVGVRLRHVVRVAGEGAADILGVDVGAAGLCMLQLLQAQNTWGGECEMIRAEKKVCVVCVGD